MSTCSIVTGTTVYFDFNKVLRQQYSLERGRRFREQTPLVVFHVNGLCRVRIPALHRHLFDTLAGSVIMTRILHSGENYLVIEVA